MYGSKLAITITINKRHLLWIANSQIICGNRYLQSRQQYEDQIRHEIDLNIDFQPTAADACYYVRWVKINIAWKGIFFNIFLSSCLAITSFWPPLHNRQDLNHTSRNFYKLTPKQRWRFKTIMCTDIIWCQSHSDSRPELSLSFSHGFDSHISKIFTRIQYMQRLLLYYGFHSCD